MGIKTKRIIFRCGGRASGWTRRLEMIPKLQGLRPCPFDNMSESVPFGAIQCEIATLPQIEFEIIIDSRYNKYIGPNAPAQSIY